MEKNSPSQTVHSLFVPVLAALLLITPPAEASKTNKTQKADPEASRLMSEGLGSLERGELSDAISALNRAVRRQGTVSSYFLLGWAHYQRGFKFGSTETADLDDAQAAIDAYAMALSVDPELTELPDRSRLYFSMALCYEAVQSYGRALDAYKMALSVSPNKALIPIHAARLRMKMHDPAKAVANIQMALKKAMRNGQEKTLRDQVRRDPVFAPLIANNETRKALGIGAFARLKCNVVQLPVPEIDHCLEVGVGQQHHEVRLQPVVVRGLLFQDADDPARVRALAIAAGQEQEFP
ncbi:MAG: hypothetical protein AAB262_00285 [Elusimicrobiota bacterium]